jgi:hypothetical protein
VRVARPDLREEILDMKDEDDRARAALLAAGRLFGAYHPSLEALHRRHGERLAVILDEVDWPSPALVGEDGLEAAGEVLLHALPCPALMRRALPLVRAAAERGEVEGRLYATLADRVRVFSGLPQVYGTQHDFDGSGRLSPEPIEDPERVDERRAEIGLPPLFEETARLRAAAEAEGERAPPDPAARRRERDEWARRAGWRD